MKFKVALGVSLSLSSFPLPLSRRHTRAQDCADLFAKREIETGVQFRDRRIRRYLRHGPACLRLGHSQRRENGS